jgi:hypothetical protein
MVWLKRKARAWATAAFILGGWTRPVQAEDRVVLLDDPARPSPGLISALHIQLTGVARLDVRQDIVNTGISARIQAASGLARSDDVLVVTWTEPAVELAGGGREAVLYVVGRKQGRALLEVVRVPGGEGPDVERSLALKLREVIDEVRHNRARATTVDVTLEPVQSGTPASPAGRWGEAAAVAAALTPLDGRDSGQWGGRMSGGAALRAGPFRLSGLLQMGVFPLVEIEREAAVVRFYELAPGLLVRAQFDHRPWWFGLRGGPQLSVVDAEARAEGSEGEASEVLASFLVGAEVELTIGGGVGIAAAIDLEGRFTRQFFTVAGERVMDLGRVRPIASIALTWHGRAVR